MDNIYMEDVDYAIGNEVKLEKIKQLIIASDGDKKALLLAIEKIVFDK